MSSSFREHPIHATIKRILEMKDLPAFGAETVASDEAHSYSRNKIFSMTQVIDKLLRSTPPELTSIAGLNSIQTYYQQVLSELTTFVSDENPGRLDNAASYMDSVLPALWAFTPGAQNVIVDVLPDLLRAQQQYATEAIRRLSGISDELSKRFADLNAEGDLFKSKIEDLSQAAARERAEGAAAVARLEQSFSEAEVVRQQAFDSTIVAHHKAYTDELTLQSETAARTLLELDAFREQAAKIVQVVGNIGATGNYQRIADIESTAANLWRWVTIGIFFIGIGVAVATFVKFWGEPFSTENAPSILIRLLYAIVITTPAWYSARESARHRSNADRARLTELELASIGPFIELLPEEKKVEIRTDLTRLYFGRASEPHTVKPPLDLETVKALILDAVKAAKP